MCIMHQVLNLYKKLYSLKSDSKVIVVVVLCIILLQALCINLFLKVREGNEIWGELLLKLQRWGTLNFRDLWNSLGRQLESICSKSVSHEIDQGIESVATLILDLLVNFVAKILLDLA